MTDREAKPSGDDVDVPKWPNFGLPKRLLDENRAESTAAEARRIAKERQDG